MKPTRYVDYPEGRIKITLIEYPTADDWYEVKRRALKTIGKRPKTAPTSAWIHSILEARHSPIRYAMYCYEIDAIPSNTSTHFARHIHAQPYISSLRNDLQEFVDGDHAPRNTPVGMIFDVNAEELQIVMNKRKCGRAAALTQKVAAAMGELAIEVTPEMDGLMVPLCVYCGGVCHEMQPCGRAKKVL